MLSIVPLRLQASAMALASPSEGERPFSQKMAFTPASARAMTTSAWCSTWVATLTMSRFSSATIFRKSVYWPSGGTSYCLPNSSMRSVRKSEQATRSVLSEVWKPPPWEYGGTCPGVPTTSLSMNPPMRPQPMTAAL